MDNNSESGEWISNYEITDTPVQASISNEKCGGCGASFHSQNPSLPGFIPPLSLKRIEMNAKKSSSKEVDQICRRCYFYRKYKFLVSLFKY